MATKKQNPLYNLLRGASMRTSELVRTGHEIESLYVTVTFSRGSKKVETIEKGAVQELNKLVRNAHDYLLRGEGYDNLRIEWKDEKGRVLKSQSETVMATSGHTPTHSTGYPAMQQPQTLSGVAEGGAMVLAGMDGAPNTVLTKKDLDNLLQERIERHDRNKEYEQLQRENQRLESELSEHKARNTELEETVAAKSKTEHYLGMVSNFLPGIGRLLGDTPLGKTLAGLAGPTEAENAEPTIPDMVRDFVGKMDDTGQNGVYLLFTAIEKDPALLARLIRSVAQQPAQPQPNNPQTQPQQNGNI